MMSELDCLRAYEAASRPILLALVSDERALLGIGMMCPFPECNAEFDRSADEHAEECLISRAKAALADLERQP
jgi:hypothetical protein